MSTVCQMQEVVEESGLTIVGGCRVGAVAGSQRHVAPLAHSREVCKVILQTSAKRKEWWKTGLEKE